MKSSQTRRARVCFLRRNLFSVLLYVFIVSVAMGTISKTEMAWAGLPTAVDDPFYSTNEDNDLNVGPEGVMANDSDPETVHPLFPDLLAELVTGPSNGLLLSLSPGNYFDGSFDYIPNPNFHGIDSFTYKIFDTLDGDDSNVATVTITVNSINDPPTISDISDQTINEDGDTGTLGFTVNDAETPPANLTVLASSSNQTLVPDANIVLGGSGTDRTVLVTPAANQSGTVTITVTVIDGDSATAWDEFIVTVTSVNDLPTISDITDQSTNEDTATAAIPFTVGDVETAAGSLNVTATSSDQAVVPNANIVLAGVGANRTITITPAPNQFGSATITVTVEDANAGTASDTFILTVNSVNDLPTLDALSDMTIDEDSGLQTVNLTGIGTGAANETQTLMLMASSTNTAIIPIPTVTYTSPNGTGTLSFTPVANANGGPVTITVTVSDTVDTFQRTFTVTVNPVNDLPTLDAISNMTIDEDSGLQTVNLTGIATGAANETQTLSITASSGNTAIIPDPTVTYSSPNATGTLSFTPVANANGGPVTVTVTVSDTVDTFQRTFTVTVNPVNDEPSFTKGGNQVVLEDAGAQSVSNWATSISAGPADEAAQALSFVVTNNTNAALFSVAPAVDAATGTLTYTPAANANGSANITIVLQDNGGGTDTSAPQIFTITVNAVNDEPSFTKGANQVVLENAPAQTVLAWATAISAGPANESGQVLTFTVANDNNGLFTVQPDVDEATGNLTYTPAPDANGLATVTIYLGDNGGTANAGDDTSPTETFTISVTSVNDEPSFTKGTDQGVLEDAGAHTVVNWATSISAGPSNESGQVLTFNISNDNNALFTLQPDVDEATGTLTYTSAPNAHGVATVTIYLTDNGGTANGGDDTSPNETFTITVTSVNDEPSFTKGANQVVFEDSAPQTINNWATSISAGPANESGQVLTFNISNDNNALFTVQPDVDETTGTLTYTPAPDANGGATVTIYLTDNGGTANGGDNTSATQTFTITVNVVNDAPTISDIVNQTINEDSDTGDLGFTIGDVETPAANLTLSASSDNTLLVPLANITFGGSDANRTVRVVPAGNQFGTAIITVTVTDADLGTASDTFQVTVNSVNDEPSFTKGADQGVLEDAGAHTVINWATSISAGPSNESGQVLTFNLSNDNNALFTVQPDVDEATGTLTYTSAPNAHGVATVTIYLADNGGTANAGDDTSPNQTFTISVTSVNDEPSFTKGPNQVVLEDAGAQTLNNWATTISAGPANESGQVLTFNISNDNNALFTVQPDVDEATGNLTYTPAPNANGMATVSIYLTDNGGTADGGDDTSPTETFTITVSFVNDPPVAVNDTGATNENAVLSIAAGSGVLTNDSDVDTADSFTVTSHDSVSAKGAAVTVNADGSYTYDPTGSAILQALALGVTTTDTFTYTITDTHSGTGTATVTITVTGVNDPPVASFSATPTSGIGPLAVSFTDTSTDIDNSIVTWNWDFGDPTAPSTLQHPSHTYNLAGTFTITLTVTDASGGTNSATTTITVTAGMSINSISVAENVGAANFTVSLTVPGVNDITVNYATADGSAVASQDYTAASSVLTIPAGSGSGTIPVTVIDDALVENDEIFTLTLSAASANATITGGATATCTILIDDLYQISVDDVTVGEEAGTVSFNVSVTPAIQVGDSVSLSYVTVNGSATAGLDYGAASSPPLPAVTFAPGDTTQNIVVTILDDNLVDPDETFSINLFNSIPAAITSIVDWAAECTIEDNERTLTIAKTGSGIGSVDVSAGAPSTLPGGTIDNAGFPQTFIYEEGDVVTLTATPDVSPDPGSIFKYWSGHISTSATPATVTMDGNKVVIAFFAQQYRLHPTLPGPGGTITPATDVIVEHGTNYTFTVDAQLPDYTVVAGVEVDGVSVASETVPNTPAVNSVTYAFVNVTANHIISARFDDFGDHCSTALPVGVPPFVSARSGYIYPAGDVDYFQIDIPSYGTLEIYTSGGTDTTGTLLANDCTNILAYNDDSSELDNNFYIKQRGLPVGTYYIAVAHWESDSLNPTGTGGYTLHVEFNASDHGDNPEDATIVGCGSSTAGTIETGGNQDWFRVDLAGNGTITVYTTGTTDTVGTLYDSFGTGVITTDNNSGTGNNFRFQRNLPAGPYYVVVSHNDPANGTGSYTLNVDCDLTFTITASALAGGSITPEGAILVSQGGSQTFTIAPDGTNTISDVKVDGASVGAVGTYTFTNVVANHTIVAEFQLPPDICVDISDVPLDARYQAAPANIMFVLDDSGSMDWEVLVQGEDGGRYHIGNTGYSYVFDDPGDHIYSSSTDNGRILSRGAERAHWESQWHGHNKMYYDPSVTYDPWPTLSNANPDTPRSHPAHATDAFNLSGSYDTVEFGGGASVTIDNLDSAPAFTKTPGNALMIQDDEDSIWATSGSWNQSTSSGYNGDYYYVRASRPNGTYTASWRPDFAVATTGVNVYVRWVYSSNHSSNVTYTIQHAAGSTNVTGLNQSDPALDGKWILLGTFDFNAGTGGRVTLTYTKTSAETISADAVSFGSPDGWNWATSSEAYGNHYWWTPQIGATYTATWTPDIPSAGAYEVQARWSDNSTRSTGVTYTINHAAGSSNVIRSQRSNGGNWVSLGTYNFNTGTTGNVTLTHTPAGTNDTACVDAMRFVQAIQTIDIKNAHYYTWYDANGNGTRNAGEIYLVNIDGGTLTYYQFTDADGDNVIDRNELLAVPGNNPPAAVITGRTYAEERQNFANWYSFYRRRELTATAAISKSIASMQGVKIGINSINHRIQQPVLSVKVGAVDESSTLLNSLYGMVLQANGTPLRVGLREVGQYFDANDGQTGGLGASPFAPAEDGGECQQAFAIVMTDGYYNESFTGFGNKDGDNNTAFDGSPYGDTYSNTLADIAMHYYERDLVTGLNNLLPVTPEDEATHQHMVTYTVSFGVHGTLNPQSYNFVSTFPTWPDPTDGDEEKIDDMWHAAVNGRGLFLSAGNPQELVDSLLAVMANIGSRVGSSSAVSVNGDELYQTLGSDIRMFQATYSSDGWTGDVKAFGVDLLTGQVLTASPLWSASAELDSRSYDSRLIATFDGVQGQPFRYVNLTDELKDLLDAADDVRAERILNYVRGDATYEQQNGFTFRNRAHKLGDVVHSSPVYEDGMLYAGANDGMLHAFNAETGVEQFAYVPKHVFDHLKDLVAPAYAHRFYVDLTPSVKQISLYGDDGLDNDTDGMTDEPDEAVSKTIVVGGLGKGGKGFYALDVTNPGAIISEAILKNRVMWEYPNRHLLTITNISAIEVSGPDKIIVTTDRAHGFSTGDSVVIAGVLGATEANGTWPITVTGTTSFELQGSDLDHAYTGGGTARSIGGGAWDDIGYSFSKPAIVNSKAGWIVIFGNGYNSSTGIAKLFILDALTGAVMKVINTEVGSCNGLSSPTPTDVDFDDKVDYVYAGDLKGNMWKFDLTSDDVNSWGVAYKSGITPKPMFQAISPEGLPQPITAKPDVMASCTAERDGYMVLFGTGRYLGEFDMYANITNSLYGVWDYGEDVDDSEYLGIFQRGSTPELSNQPDEVTLLEQTTVLSTETDPNFFTVTLGPGQTLKIRVITAQEIDWTTTSLSGATTCSVNGLGLVPCDLNGTGVKADPAAHAGWYYDLPLDGERVVSDVLLRQGRAIFVPYTPLETPCGSGGNSVLMELEACSGSRPNKPVMDINGDGVIDENDLIEIAPGVFVAASGIQFSGRLQPPAILILDSDREKKYSASSNGTIVTITEKAVTLGITHWMEIE